VLHVGVTRSREQQPGTASLLAAKIASEAARQGVSGSMF
jgi:hypothetical protein